MLNNISIIKQTPLLILNFGCQRCNVQPKAKHAPSNKESKLSHSTFDIDIRFLPTGELYPISGEYNMFCLCRYRL